MPHAQAQKLSFDIEYPYGGTLYAWNTAAPVTIDPSSGKVETCGWSDSDGDGVPYASVGGYTITTTGIVIKVQRCARRPPALTATTTGVTLRGPSMIKAAV